MKTIIWTAMDGDGRVDTYTHKPNLPRGSKTYRRADDDNEQIISKTNLFNIPLKPLQIAEISVNENGTWSYEIEREEGWYMGCKDGTITWVVQYRGGKWLSRAGDPMPMPITFTISKTRIPDECII